MRRINKKTNLKIIYISIIALIMIGYYIIRFLFLNRNNYFLIDFLIDIVLLSFFIIIVIFIKKDFFKKLIKIEYRDIRNQYKKLEFRQRIFKHIKYFIIRTNKRLFGTHPRKIEIKNFSNEFKKYINNKKKVDPLKYQSILKIFKEILNRKHPLEYFIQYSQTELMRFVFEKLIDNLYPQDIGTLYKSWKKRKFPTMKQIFNLVLLNTRPADITKLYDKLSLGNIDELIETINLYQKLSIFKFKL